MPLSKHNRKELEKIADEMLDMIASMPGEDGKAFVAAMNRRRTLNKVVCKLFDMAGHDVGRLRTVRDLLDGFVFSASMLRDDWEEEEREEAEPDAKDDADGGAEAPGRVGG